MRILWKFQNWEILTMWIWEKIWFRKCEVCKKSHFEILNFVKNHTLKMWIFSKIRFSNYEFLDKSGFLTKCELRNKYEFEFPAKSWKWKNSSNQSCQIDNVNKSLVLAELFLNKTQTVKWVTLTIDEKLQALKKALWVVRRRRPSSRKSHLPSSLTIGNVQLFVFARNSQKIYFL